MTFKIILLSFFTFSFFGWIAEIIYTRITDKEWVNRGFLVGPICPIYGIGCILTLILFTNKEDIVSVGLKIMAICAILEYFTSYIFEKIFHARWWDYSEKKFNINGRICLETLILFAIFGVLFVFVVNPVTSKMFNMIPDRLYYIILILLLIIFITDILISSKIIFKFRNYTKKNSKNLDRTEEISKLVRKKISEKSKLLKRLLKAFPHIKAKTKLAIKIK